jgi:excisionase family DNA binding protein
MKKNELVNELLTIKEFAEKIRAHPNTIRRAIHKGHISAFRIGVGKRSSFRIPRSEIDRMALFNLEEMIGNIKE